MLAFYWCICFCRVCVSFCCALRECLLLKVCDRVSNLVIFAIVEWQWWQIYELNIQHSILCRISISKLWPFHVRGDLSLLIPHSFTFSAHQLLNCFLWVSVHVVACVICQRCVWHHQLSCCQATTSTTQCIDGDLWRFLAQLSPLHFCFLNVCQDDFYSILLSVYKNRISFITIYTAAI